MSSKVVWAHPWSTAADRPAIAAPVGMSHLPAAVHRVRWVTGN
ncbi:hypothetical protein [Micromonospora sp. NBC_01739]|nr:hypothetical protein OIE53_23045 [Micromonospora sp. NBC_01739]